MTDLGIWTKIEKTEKVSEDNLGLRTRISKKTCAHPLTVWLFCSEGDNGDNVDNASISICLPHAFVSLQQDCGSDMPMSDLIKIECQSEDLDWKRLSIHMNSPINTDGFSVVLMDTERRKVDCFWGFILTSFDMQSSEQKGVLELVKPRIINAA